MYAENIKALTKENTNFRKVLVTGKNSQLVVMSIPPRGEIGEEAHRTIDQILVFVEGDGEAIVGGQSRGVSKHDVVFVPAGTVHNFRNVGAEDLKLYTVYAPPAHPDGTIHKTKEEADIAEKAEQNT